MILTIVLGIASAFAVELVVVQGYQDRAVSQRTAIVRNECSMLCNTLVGLGYLESPENEVVSGKLDVLTSIYGGRILVINRDYRIVRDTYDLDTGKYILSQEVVDCFQGVESSQYDNQNNYIQMTVKITDSESGDDAVEGVMLCSVSTAEISASRKILEQKGIMILAVIVAAILLLSYITSGFLVRPFQKITRSIEDLTDGYLEESISVSDYFETELISDAFNRMLGRIRALDTSRQEFVANVSHELKTPLTSMKVLADALNGQENVPLEQYQEFMQDISSEIDRENSIITDLLSLVKLDKDSTDLNMQECNINQLLELIVKRLTPIAALAKVDLVLDTFRPVNAEVDETKLTLALSNIMENAIKYNKPEGGWVRISLNADSKYFYVTVADSGLGIPEDSVDHIFERFYRADKSHSREIGGTGLGLAITRSTVVLHRGAIKVHSVEGEGTTMSVRIPLTYHS